MKQQDAQQKQGKNIEPTENNVGHLPATPSENRYTDLQAAPRNKFGSSGFANLARNKSIPPDLTNKVKKEIRKFQMEAYQEKSNLFVHKSKYVVFKNDLFDIKSIIKEESKNYLGLISVREYVKQITNN